MHVNRRSSLWRYISLGCLTLVCFKLYLRPLLWPDLAQLMELEKCPACFGTSLCPAFIGGNVTISGYNTLSAFLSLFGSKNVLFGSLDDKKVVLKKLGHNWELEELDDLLWGEHVITERAPRGNDIRTAITNHLTHPLGIDSSYGLRLCPSATNLDHFLKDIFLKNRDVKRDELYMSIWTLLVLNGEPLILQVLDEAKGWPVPKYYGACGRVVVEEYAGDMLSSYLQASWYTRARLSYKLLVAARDFTNKHPHFGFYLPDMSMDNIAVDGAGNVKFIDLEDMIVVDKQLPEKEWPASWNTSHESEIFDCNDKCFAFATDDICNHHISDHNYYAVCQELLSSDDGLLHGIPPEVLKEYPMLPDLIKECVEPSVEGGRFVTAEQLIIVLVSAVALPEMKLQ